jgi:hypothetical protein
MGGAVIVAAGGAAEAAPPESKIAKLVRYAENSVLMVTLAPSAR